jgi:hypothetical protein
MSDSDNPNRLIELGIINSRLLDICLAIINEVQSFGTWFLVVFAEMIYFTCCAQERAALNYPELQDIKAFGINNLDAVYRESESINEVSQQSIADENAIEMMTDRLRTALTLEEEDDENLFSLKEKVLTK